MDIWLQIDRPLDSGVDLPLKNEASHHVIEKYKAYWGQFIVWANSKEGTIGCIRYNRSISMPITDVRRLELQEVRPAKGDGHIHLAFVSHNGEYLGGISSKNTQKSFAWLSHIQPIIANKLNLTQKYIDCGYDA